MKKIRKPVVLFLVAALITLMPTVTSTTAAPANADEGDNAFIAKAEQLYYYDKGREKRYIKYHHQHPQYKADKVIWHVGADLDKTAHNAPIKISGEDAKTITVLVNKQHKLPSNYAPPKLAKVGSALMVPKAAKAVKALIQAAKKDGVRLYAYSNGYRSYAVQKSLNSNTGTKQHDLDSSSARAGFSEHQTGLTIDMTTANGQLVPEGVAAAKWLRENSWKYGLIVRYTEKNKSITQYIGEPWHIRYIGEAHSTRYYNEKFVSYEEYWVKYIAHTPTAEQDISES